MGIEERSHARGRSPSKESGLLRSLERPPGPHQRAPPTGPTNGRGPRILGLDPRPALANEVIGSGDAPKHRHVPGDRLNRGSRGLGDELGVHVEGAILDAVSGADARDAAASAPTGDELGAAVANDP